MGRNNKKIVLRPTASKNSENRLRDFGYGLQYKNISAESLRNIIYPFVIMIKDDYLTILQKLNQRVGIDDSNIVVIHERDISDRNIQLIKK